MTTPIEALELKPCPFCGASADIEPWHGGAPTKRMISCSAVDCEVSPCVTGETETEAVTHWNARATASLEGDAVERVARIISRAMLDNPSGGTSEERAAKRKAIATEYAAAYVADTGLVAGEAAIRGDWHTTGWDRARNSGRILLVWREFAGVKEHVELGRYSDSRTAWVNTYGHPFHAEPDGWAPLLPFKTAEAIRADEVKDTYLVGGADLKAMSGDIDSSCVIKLHFNRRVTDKDREWLLDAINLKIKADQDASAIRSGGGE